MVGIAVALATRIASTDMDNNNCTSCQLNDYHTLLTDRQLANLDLAEAEELCAQSCHILCQKRCEDKDDTTELCRLCSPFLSMSERRKLQVSNFCKIFMEMSGKEGDERCFMDRDRLLKKRIVSIVVVLLAAGKSAFNNWMEDVRWGLGRGHGDPSHTPG